MTYALRKYWAIARAQLLNITAYRARLVSMFLFYTLFIYVFFNLWRAIYQGGEVAGYTLVQIVWYLCCTEIVAFGARAPLLSEVGRDIRSGAIAYQLGRPYDFVGFYFASSAAEMLVGMAAIGALGGVLGLLFVGPIPAYAYWALPLCLLSLLLGVCLQFFMQMCATLTALWLEDSSGVSLILQKLVFMLGVFIPVEFLPRWLAPAARLLPFSYVAWAPSRLMVAFSWELFLQVLPVQIIYVAGFALLSRFMFSRGMHAMEAHGG